jgi:hypothetical protein
VVELCRVASTFDERAGDILGPLDAEWTVKTGERDVPARVRELRTAILPEFVEGGLSHAERDRPWDQLNRLNLAQRLSLYPPAYLDGHPSTERVLETVESANLPSAAYVRAKLLRHLSVSGWSAPADEAFCPSYHRRQICHWTRWLGAPPAPKDELNLWEWEKGGKRHRAAETMHAEPKFHSLLGKPEILLDLSSRLAASGCAKPSSPTIVRDGSLGCFRREQDQGPGG